MKAPQKVSKPAAPFDAEKQKLALRPVHTLLEAAFQGVRWLISRQSGVLTAAIVAVAAAFRLRNLAGVPGPFADEVLAAVDIHYLRSSGQHFNGAHAGLLAHIIPALDGRLFVALFSTGSVGDLRLVSAAFGIATVGLMIPLGAELGFPILGYLAAAALAVMPWHIYFSRVYFPGSEYLFLTCLSLVLLLAGLRKASLPLLIGAVMAASATIYLYPVSITTTPLLIAGVLLFRFDESRRLGLLRIFIPLVVGLALMAPYVAGHLETSDQTVANANSVVDTKLIWNHGMTVGELAGLFARNWAGYLTPQFILLNGDPNPAHSIQTMGEAGWVTGFIGFIGILVGIVKRTRLHLLLLFWLLIYPIGDALSYYDAAGNSLRGLSGSVIWALWAASGVMWLLQIVRPQFGQAIAWAVSAAVFLQCVAFTSFYFGPYITRYGYLFETGYGRIYADLVHRGLAGVPITLHAGYERDAMLQYFSGYRLHASQSVLACHELPFDVLHYTVIPRVFIVKEDPGFSALPDCINSGLVIRDKTALTQPSARREEVGRKLDVIDDFASDSTGMYRTAIYFVHY